MSSNAPPEVSAPPRRRRKSQGFWARLIERIRPSRGRRVRIVLLCTLLSLFGLLWAFLAYLSPNNIGKQVTLDEFETLVTQRRVVSATVLDEDARIVGRVSAVGGGTAVPTQETPGSQIAPSGGTYWVSYPRNDPTTSQLITQLTSSGARVRVDPQSAKGLVRLVTTAVLPLIILANLFALVFGSVRGGGSGIGDVVDFSKIGKEGSEGTRAVTFADVAGCDEAIIELREVVDYLTNPQRYEGLGATPPKGVLLFGPPGCGKTLLAKAVAGEAHVPFFSVAGAEFVESLVGVGAARVRDLFAKVRKVSPAIVFLDELDAAGRRRGGGGVSGAGEERDQTLNQLLVEMDGFDVSSGIVIIGATNRPDILDPALLRPGRFDRHITVERPDLERRQAVLELHARTRPVRWDVDFQSLARQTPGFTGADLANVVNEGALLTIRTGAAEISPEAFSEAIQRVLAGPQRRGHLLTPEERSRVAYHEAGHAIVAALVGRGGDVHRVSIIARGRGIGSVGLMREDDSVVITRTQLRSRMLAALGGWAAEQVAFGEPSTGAEDDLEEATTLARDMAGRYGMSENLGLLRLSASNADMYLGGEVAVGAISPETHAAFDREVRRIVEDVQAEALSLVRTNRDWVDHLAQRLLDEESLEGDALIGMLPHPGSPAIGTEPVPEPASADTGFTEFEASQYGHRTEPGSWGGPGRYEPR